MKIIAVNGSPKKEGNTATALNIALEELNSHGIETELLHIGNEKITGCMGCGACKKTGRCAFADEKFQEWCNKLYEADGMILGSPVYYANLSGTMKCFLDRLFFSSQGRFRHKVGAALSVARRSGEICTFDALNKYFLISEMLVAPSYYWTSAHGGTPGQITEDKEGVTVIQNMARNMAWILKMKENTKDTLTPPTAVPREHTGFIR